MLIAIPSKGRAGRIRSQKLLNGATLYVPADEEQVYFDAHSLECQVVGVPSSVKGITRTRNWILDNTDDEWVVFVDDDVKIQGWTELQPRCGKQRKLTGDQWTAEFVRLFELTEAMNYRVWGVATQSALRSIYPYRPILFQSYLTASCMGILPRSGLRFDEDFPVKEDYELGLRCVQEDGGIIAARYLYWVNEHWTTDGGCRDYRTQEMEATAIRNLQRKYPGRVKRILRGGCEYSIELVF